MRMSDQFAIATLCSAGYLHWLEHLHRNLLLLRPGLHRLTVCVTDQQTRAAARMLQLDTLVVGDTTERRHATAHTFGTEAYARVTRHKASCVLGIMTRRRPPPALLFTDTDVTFFASPWPHLPLHTADIALLDDSGPSQATHNTLSSSLFFVRNTLPLRELWRELISHNAARPELPDQLALNRLLANRTGPGLRVARLDPARFVNGYRFYERNRSRHEVRPQQALSLTLTLAPP